MLAKSAPSRSSRQQSTAVWERVAQAASGSSPRPNVPGSGRPTASSSSARFPPLKPSATPPPAMSGYRQPVRNTAWSTSSGSGAQPVRSVPGPGASSSSRPDAPQPPKISNALFPELPSTSQTKRPAVSGNNGSLQKIIGSNAPKTSAWAGGGNAATSGESAAEQTTTEQRLPANAAAGAKKKGKGKQKQTLFTLGTFPT
jgi:E3 ubiquitin-protein ligase ZNF598